MKPTVWIVDDDRSIRWVMEKALQKTAMTVRCFESAVHLLDALQTDQPDTIVSDIRMPGMDGLTLLPKLLELSSILQVVMVSAYGDMPNIRQAMNQGAYDFLTKPINFEDLNKTIEKTKKNVETRR